MKNIVKYTWITVGFLAMTAFYLTENTNELIIGGLAFIIYELKTMQV